MKNLLLIFLFVLPLKFIAQQNNDSEINYYLQKSNTKRKTANALLITGGGLMLTGILVGSSGNQNNTWFFSPNQIAGAGIFTLGVLSSLVSVPFYLSAHHNKNQSLKITPSAMIINSNPQNKNYAALGLKITF